MAKKDKNERLSAFESGGQEFKKSARFRDIALKPVEISAELPEKDNAGKKLGLKVSRRFTKPGENVFDTVQWDKRTTTISDEKGNIISQITDVEVPTTWTQLATDILAYKYLRKAGVPTKEGREVSLKQAVYRIAHTIADFGEKFDYFATNEDRNSFEDELTHILVTQKAAFNSPVWFNCGLYHQYQIAGSGGSFYWDFEQEKVLETKDSYRNPQCSACFILSVGDSLDEIYNLLKTESRVFKFGSGAGANFSKLRSRYERLSGGGTSSGMMSFLRVFDRSADAVKSGGTTRRAAKMVVVDMSHPEIEDFINWKVNEEKKVMALIAAGYPSDFNGEAYHTVSGQNSNNSVRMTDEFMEATQNDGEWTTRTVNSGEPYKTYRAKDLMDQVAKAAWQCADPGVQFDTTANKWHTCPNSGRINATNPCAEYTFLDDSSCNLASINLVKFTDDKGNFDVESYRHACKVMFIAQEIEVDLSSYPTEVITKNSHDYRPLGLGYANLGTMLMLKGVPYDSPEALAIAGALSAILTGHAYKTSSEIAAVKGAFGGFARNRAPMLNVMKMHRQAAFAIDESNCPSNLLAAARQDWDEAVALGEQFGYRNSQATVIAPTGCLVGNSLVSTDRGLVRLQKLGQTSGEKWQDTSFKVMTDDGPKQATKFFVNGQQSTRRIITKGGYEIQGTAKHRIKVVDPITGSLIWKRFDQLQPTDVVPLALNTLFGRTHFVPLPPLSEPYWASNEFITAPNSINPDLAELIGYFMGDGSLHSKGLRFCVTNGDEDVIARLIRLGKKLFNLEAKITAMKGYTEIAFQSVALTIWWDACGFAKHTPESKQAHRGKGYQPHIPDILLATNDRSVYQAFLRGLFEADGTASGGVPVFSSASHQFSQEIASLLLALGYPITRKVGRSGWGKKELYVLRIRNASYNPAFKASIGFISKRKTRLLINLSAHQSGKHDYVYLPRTVFEELIPTGSPERGSALQSLTRYGALSRGLATKVRQRVQDSRLETALQYIYDPIVSNTDGGIVPTYDLSVPENVTYIANGFVSHNTIGLLMDCDTTGVEPDFALVKFKKLAGGGSMKIVNNAVKQALQNLGYTQDQQQEIIDYALGVGRFIETTPINRSSLADKGLTSLEIDTVEKTLLAAFDISFSFNRMVLGDDIFTRLGISIEEEKQPNFSLLGRLGFTTDQIAQSNLVICGTQTVEGAPHLKEEHLAVFDCANRCGPTGTRFIAPLAHVRMMAAVQPFISGAISKTINMPNEATVEDVEEVYLQSWKMGLKALALYRDGSKLSQPLNTKKDDTGDKTEVVERVVEKIVYAPKRRRMPDERRSITHKFSISGHKGYITVGLFDDGTPGEIFVTMAKQGSTISGLMDAFAKSVSVGLQYGVPLAMIVRQFANSRFEPYGFTTNPQIRIAKSIIDYIARYIGIKFLNPEQQIELGIKADIDASNTQGQLDFNATAPAVKSDELNGDVSNNVSPSDQKSASAPEATVAPTVSEESEVIATIKQQQIDAPPCPSCGSLTFKTGTCYTCLSCGSTTGGCS